MVTGLCDAFEPFAVSGENLNAQFRFQFQYGFGDPGLRGVKCLGDLCEVHVAFGCLMDKLKLVKIHGEFIVSASWALEKERFEVPPFALISWPFMPRVHLDVDIDFCEFPHGSNANSGTLWAVSNTIGVCSSRTKHGHEHA